MPANALPNDIDTLKRMLVSRDETIAKLVAEIARLKRWQYGRSSERISELMDQLQLALGDLPEAAGESLPVAEAPANTAPAQQSNSVTVLRRKPRAFPTHLPRETIVHAPAGCGCPHCGGQLRTLGEDISETLDYIPGYFKVNRHVRPKLACRTCSHIEQVPAPSRPITRGMADAGLVAQVVVAKYADHAPLYRQEQIYRRAGVQLERATLAAWVRESSRLLEPLSQALGRYVRQADKIHTDDTPVPVLDPGWGKTRTGRLWTYVRDDRPAGSRAPPAVWYQYSPDRKGERPQKHLQGFSGILQADAYSGYADDGRGFSIGFDSEVLCKSTGLPSLAHGDESKLTLNRVEYDTNEARRTIHSYVEGALSAIRTDKEYQSKKPADLSDKEKYELLNAACHRYDSHLLRGYQVTVKNPAFIEESEYRLVHMPLWIANVPTKLTSDLQFSLSSPKYRISGDRICTYFEFDLCPLIAAGVIKEIWLGPKNQTTGMDLDAFLGDSGLSLEHAQVQQSRATYR